LVPPSTETSSVPPSKPLSKLRRCQNDSREVVAPAGMAMPVAPLGCAKLKSLLTYAAVQVEPP
jgi:hypothetical protein